MPRTADIGRAGLLYWVGDDGQMHARWVPPRSFDREARRYDVLPRRKYRSARPFRTFADMQTVTAEERRRGAAIRRDLDDLHARVIAEEAKEAERTHTRGERILAGQKKRATQMAVAREKREKLEKAKQARLRQERLDWECAERHARQAERWHPRVAFSADFLPLRLVEMGPAGALRRCDPCLELIAEHCPKLQVVTASYAAR